jgi:hypothetical protein
VNIDFGIIAIEKSRHVMREKVEQDGPNILWDLYFLPSEIHVDHDSSFALLVSRKIRYHSHMLEEQ